VTISTAIPADARGGEHLITVGTDGTALTADCTTTVITEDQTPPGGRCTSCQTETRYSLSFFGGATFPHGAFNTIADSSYSLGVKPAFHFPAFGGDASLGFYFGRDNFSNPAPGGDFHLTHFSPEFEFAPTKRFCPTPSLHIGAGAYRNENDNFAFGFNVGAGLSICVNRRISLLWRYDYRSVNDFSRNYSTVQGGVRFHF
jgi:opacity protein-like surface antigen